MKKRSILLLVLIVTLILTMMPQGVFAASLGTVKTIDLNSKKDLSGKGYYWDASKRTLTLTDADIKDCRITIPSKGDLTIILKGENHIHGSDPLLHSCLLCGVSHDTENITIRGDGTGSLFIETFLVMSCRDLRIENCTVVVQPPTATWGEGEDAWSKAECGLVSAGRGDFYITDGARVIVDDGVNAGYNVYIDGGYLEVRKRFRNLYVDVDKGLYITNGGELHSTCYVRDMTKIYVDETSVLDVQVDEEPALCPSVASLEDEKTITILGKEVHLSSPEKAIGLGNYIPERMPVPEGTFHSGKMRLEDLGKEYHYVADSVAADKERIKAGVEATTLTLKSQRTAKGNIKLTWTKSPGYRVDYYEVFRSTKRFSGYTDKAFFRTQFGLKRYYTNTNGKRGTRYYYKVRGVRVIDGETYYTKWSNKAWRIA